MMITSAIRVRAGVWDRPGETLEKTSRRLGRMV